jgi:hypothetical protein
MRHRTAFACVLGLALLVAAAFVAPARAADAPELSVTYYYLPG